MLREGWTSCGFLPDLLGGRLLTGGCLRSERWSAVQPEEMMSVALRLATRAQGHAAPNPSVGCVAFKGDEVVCAGWTQPWGGFHAERHALQSAGLECFPPGCDVYVTLEPCSHTGKTPPCAELFDRGGGRVFVATTDPFAQVNGRGIERLRKLGNQVHVGIMEAESRALLLPFLKDVMKQRLWVGLKWAQSVDGCLADHQAVSQWLTGSSAQRYTHALRQRYDAIAVGWQTLLHDQPALTARLVDESAGLRHPLRICLDPRGEFLRLSLAERSKLVRKSFSGQWILISADRDFISEAEVSNLDQEEKHRIDPMLCRSGMGDELCVVRVPAMAFFDGLESALRDRAVADRSPLNRPYVQSLLVEGGPGMHNLFLSAGRFDMIHALVAPLILGGERFRIGRAGGGRGSGFPVSLGDAGRMKLLQNGRAGDDVVLEWATQPTFDLLEPAVLVDKAGQE